MKIVCDSCSAKYSIADEKVAGRVFKIRCKKCGAAIVVRGDQVDTAAETEEASTRVVDYGGDAVWHIVVDGEQQGPFAPSQLGEMLSAGTIGWDAFVWREGFDDWKPAQDIEDLVQAIMGGAQQAEAGTDAGAAEADPFAATQHAASAEPEGGMFGAPAAVASRSNDAGADLFAQTDAASPFGGGGAEEEDDVVASSPSPRVSADQALTGARNENSVLFSLSNLQALATGPGGGGSSPSSAGSVPSASPKPGMAAGEGSGLIDIRALASATGVAPGSSGPVTSASSDNKVDDLLSIGGAGSIGLGSSLGAPVLIPEKKEESSKMPLFLMGGAVVLALAAVAIMGIVMFTGDDGEPPVAAAGAVAPGQTVAAAGAAAPEPTPTAPAADPAAPTAQAVGAAAPEPEEEEAAADSEEDEPEEERAARRGRTRRERPRASAGGSGDSSEREEPAPRRRSSGSSDIDDLLNEAIGGGGGGGGGSRGGGGGGGGASGPETPSRSSVVSAMRGVQGAVSACGNGAHGMATVQVTFGSNGRVRGANVSGSLPGPVKSCISRAVRRARVPAFRQSSFSVNYPFRI